MKRLTTLLLVFVMVLSLTACGSAPAGMVPAEIMPETISELTTEPTSEPTTEPTLSAEELFIQSLPEKLRQAYELGIVDLPLLEDPERPCTTAEAAGILQNICRIKFGDDSWMLTNAVTEENAAQPATRGWFMTQMYTADAESLVGVDESETYAANLKKLTWSQKQYCQDIADALLGEQTNTGYVLVDEGEELPSRYISAYGEYAGAAKLVADRDDFDGDIVAVSYALTRYDRTTGEKLMTWDEEKKLHFLDEMTVQEVVETGLRYFRALESKETVPSESVGTYDTTIITSELLSRETTLPEASCAHLPAEWHGISYTYSAKLEEQPLESDIQIIKNAGFNFIRCSIDFTHFYGFDPEKGEIHEGRMKELDQLLAWCMERDIHLNLGMYWNYDWPDGFDSKQLVRQSKYSESIAKTWRVFARRYVDIPGKYLSFTLLDHAWGSTDEENGTFLAPAAEAIQEESPQRCIMAKAGKGNVSGASIASRGVALTSDCTWGENFYFTDYYSDRKAIMQKAVWPYEENGEIVDGNAVLSRDVEGSTKNAPDTVAATAREYGVGYMVGEWGPRRDFYGLIVEDVRYGDETMEAYLTDISQAMQDRGYGWCYTDWMGSVGIVFCAPLVHDTAYVKPEGQCLYIDEEMFGWFQSINGVQ
jgi:aryl-phospho-beta-D-glucosidase BglC (GH1 family)